MYKLVPVAVVLASLGACSPYSQSDRTLGGAAIGAAGGALIGGAATGACQSGAGGSPSGFLRSQPARTAADAAANKSARFIAGNLPRVR